MADRDALLARAPAVQGESMLARLLLALLIALLPLPAAAGSAACHSAPVAAEGHHGHAKPSAPDRAPAAAEQLCVGCVAPATLRAPFVAGPLDYAREVRVPRASPGLARAASPPATPPPRSAA